MTNFNDYGLSEFLLSSLERMGITTPTPIQSLSIPVSMTGKDILASAQTGTGKTISYLLPVLNALANNNTDCALVLVPTRELAIQVKDATAKLLGRKPFMNIALLIGGEPITKQFFQLKKQPKIIIGTPGRINDHLSRKTLDLSKTSFLILDETDRMLDMGFSEQLDEINKYLPQERQTLMFSATMPKAIIKLAQKYLTEPERIAIGSTTSPTLLVKQDSTHIKEGEKFTYLLQELNSREGSVIVFVKTKIRAEEIADRLRENNHEANAIHGDLHQRKRERAIKSFRNNKNRIMVATDIAARGLDVPHIMHVINYDLPQCPEDYIHRIGRTGRAGVEGFALSLISGEDKNKWKIIDRLINQGIESEQSRDYSPASRKPDGRNRSRFGQSSSEEKGRRTSKPFGSRDDKPRKDWGAKDSKPFGSRDDKPKKDWGNKESKPFGSRDDRPKKDWGAKDSKPFGSRDDKPKKDWGNKDSKPFGSRDSARKSFKPRKASSF